MSRAKSISPSSLSGSKPFWQFDKNLFRVIPANPAPLAVWRCRGGFLFYKMSQHNKLTNTPMKTPLKSWLIAGSLFAQSVSITSALAAGAQGNWLWVTPGRNGAPDRESILHLESDGTHLSGKISSPGPDGKPIDVAISHGETHGDSVSFQVVRAANGTPVTNTYSGTIAGEKITGKIEFVRNGEVRSREWEAKNTGDRAVAAAVPGPKPGYDEAGHKIVNETHFKLLPIPEAEKFLAQHPDAIILDLRPPENYAAGHLPGAKNYDVTDDANYKSVLAPLDKNKWYLVHSVVGHFRTVRALEYFEANGFQHAAAIDGGYQAWVAAGKPVVK